MLFLIIFISILLVFSLVFFLKNKKKKVAKIEINFEDIDSLNVSKIVTEENDIDFIRNELWYTYKQRQIVNLTALNQLKHIFETQHKLKINDSINDKFILNENVEISFLIEKIINSDDYEIEDIASTFLILGNKTK